MIEHPLFKESWQRDVEESVRQGNANPFVQEAVLQVSNWGFKLTELKVKKKHKGKGFLVWLKSIYEQEDESMNGFLGPIHIWQVSVLSASLLLKYALIDFTMKRISSISGM